MARTIADIKKSLTTEFMNNTVIAQKYGFEPGADFDAIFSQVSIENILFYVFSAASYVLEVLFDTHKKEVNELMDSMIPHRPKWYRDKALNFMKDKTLIEDSDQYDTTGMSEADIEAAKVVKYATAIEEQGSSILVIKIAGGASGALEPIPNGDNDTENIQAQFESYIQQIKDAGVRFNVVNQVGDAFQCKLVIYYNATLLETDVRSNILNAIKAYLTGLPFNGEYSNMALIDAIQKVSGVEIADIKSASSGNPFVIIPEKVIPQAGYFTYLESNIDLTLIAYEG